MKPRKRNPTDTTLRNNRATAKRLKRLEAEHLKLKWRVDNLWKWRHEVNAKLEIE